MDAKEISQKLSQEAQSIAEMLLPNGKRDGQEWVAGSVHGEAGQSLKVHLSGSKAGVWKDFSSDSRGGDLLDLWREVKGVTMAETLREAKRYLGIADTQFHGSAPKTYAQPVKPEVSAPKGNVLAYLTGERKLSLDALRAYKIGASKDDTEIVFPFLRNGELLNVKHLKLDRQNGKKIMRVAAGCEPCLFGWQAIPETARSVTICEGELDAVTLWQYGYPALSIFSGAGNHQWVENEYEHLERFSEIFLVFDNDAPGKKGVAELVNRLGRHRCKIVELLCKDANECLQKDLPKECVDELFAEAQSLDPVELRSASSYVNEVINEFYGQDAETRGCPFPWKKTHDQVRLRRSELSLWTGINSHGKSQVLGHVMLCAAAQGERICIFSGEMKPKVLLKRMARQATALAEPSDPYIRAVHHWYDGKFWLFDLVGTAKAERILEVFKYARKRYGITHFVIDSLMKCGIAEDDYRSQKNFVDALADFKNEYDCHVHLVAHACKGEKDETKTPGRLDVKGTGAISDIADNSFSVWRNKNKELALMLNPDAPEKDKPDAIVTCDKQRNGEWEGRIYLNFDKSSLQYLANSSDRPRPFVHFTMHAVADEQIAI